MLECQPPIPHSTPSHQPGPAAHSRMLEGLISAAIIAARPQVLGHGTAPRRGELVARPPRRVAAVNERRLPEKLGLRRLTVVANHLHVGLDCGVRGWGLEMQRGRGAERQSASGAGMTSGVLRLTGAQSTSCCTATDSQSNEVHQTQQCKVATLVPLNRGTKWQHN